jgi:hypothetical protein
MAGVRAHRADARTSDAIARAAATARTVASAARAVFSDVRASALKIREDTRFKPKNAIAPAMCPRGRPERTRSWPNCTFVRRDLRAHRDCQQAQRQDRAHEQDMAGVPDHLNRHR